MVDKLCKCGNCSDAYERALGVVSKVILDDECGIFVYAQAETIKALAVNTIATMITSDLPKNVSPEVEWAHIMAEGPLVTGGVTALVNEFWTANRNKIEGDYAAIIGRLNEKHQKLANLPKGD